MNSEMINNPMDWDDDEIRQAYDQDWSYTIERLARITGRDRSEIRSILNDQPKPTRYPILHDDKLETLDGLGWAATEAEALAWWGDDDGAQYTVDFITREIGSRHRSRDVLANAWAAEIEAGIVRLSQCHGGWVAEVSGWMIRIAN